MNALFQTLLNDEAGFIVSAELVLIATICVLGLVVGLAELSHNINNELEDVGSAFSCIQQTYNYQCTHGHRGSASGSSFTDYAEFCEEPDSIH
ncbi:MAG: branched-chain amino acid aminotransferase [Planctomycetaceae bacterium]|nr:branched-chain amino acid aminotransferase [Planctomycetaceae bacterium]